jgi:hypothetical protein
MTAYTDHGKTSSAERNCGRKPELGERDRCTLHRIVSTQLTAELNTHPVGAVSTNTVRRQLHKSNVHRRAAIAKPLITENKSKRPKDGVLIIKAGVW